MADQTIFMRTKMLQLKLSHKLAFHVRACEKTVVFVMQATVVYSVYTPRRFVGTTFRQSETACSVKKKSLTALRQVLKNATTINSNFAMRNSAMMRTTKTKYAAGLLAALCTTSILFFRSTT